MSLKSWVTKRVFNDVVSVGYDNDFGITDASASAAVITPAKILGLRAGDTTSKDFEDPEIDLKPIQAGYNTDSYIRQGVDKYVDRIYKEGYEFYCKDENVTAYIKTRFDYMARVTGIPMEQLLHDIGNGIVEYGNTMLAKSRMVDQSQLPQGVSVAGINGLEPVVGYFPINPATMQIKRDKTGLIKAWQQTVDGSDKPTKFKSEDIVHMYYKRQLGNGFGTPFLIPVLDDVRALRQSEEDVLRMIHRNIYPFYHIAVGDKEISGTTTEINNVKNDLENMDIEAGLVTSNRVVIKPIASDQIIDASPYLKYLEERVFSGMGIPGVLFGRGDTANRSTSDSMSDEMADRIKAMQKVISVFINDFMVNDLLLEGGYDPTLNPDQKVIFRFKENELDVKIQTETHAVYLYEHNTITEDEMRAELGRDPITDRTEMFQTLVTQQNAIVISNATQQNSGGSSATPVKTKLNAKASLGTKQTNNKEKPTNQHGTKSSPKKTTNSGTYTIYTDMRDSIFNDLEKNIPFNKELYSNNGIFDDIIVNDKDKEYIIYMHNLLINDIDSYIRSEVPVGIKKSNISCAVDNYESIIINVIFKEVI